MNFTVADVLEGLSLFIRFAEKYFYSEYIAVLQGEHTGSSECVEHGSIFARV